MDVLARIPMKGAAKCDEHCAFGISLKACLLQSLRYLLPVIFPAVIVVVLLRMLACQGVLLSLAHAVYWVLFSSGSKLSSASVALCPFAHPFGKEFFLIEACFSARLSKT